MTGCDYTTIVFVEVFKIRKVKYNNYRMLQYVNGKLNKVKSEHIDLSLSCTEDQISNFFKIEKAKKRYVMLSQYVCCHESAYKLTVTATITAIHLRNLCLNSACFMLFFCIAECQESFYNPDPWLLTPSPLPQSSVIYFCYSSQVGK